MDICFRCSQNPCACGENPPMEPVVDPTLEKLRKLKELGELLASIEAGPKDELWIKVDHDSGSRYYAAEAIRPFLKGR